MHQVYVPNRLNPCHKFGKALYQIEISSWKNNTIFKKLRDEGMHFLLDNSSLSLICDISTALESLNLLSHYCHFAPRKVANRVLYWVMFIDMLLLTITESPCNKNVPLSL